MTGTAPRDAAPPWLGEGAFALWHFSEDPSLSVLEPHVPVTNKSALPHVWAVDTRHSPLFWFPRDCPRGCVWATASTSEADSERFFAQSASTRLHVVESSWLGRLRDCRLYAYRLPTEGFEPDEVGGYFTSGEPVEVLERTEVGDLLDAHGRADIELRVTPSIWPFWRLVVDSTLGFSGCRLANARPHPDGWGSAAR